MVSFRIGTSGWHYDHWRDRFYPEGLPKDRWLEYYGESFTTVEVNASFYRLPTERALARWRDGSPPNFLFAVKASRLITHYRRLRNVAELLDTFLDRARLLGDKLGPILYQLPPQFVRDDETLGDFLAQLPENFRHVLEFRHASWLSDEVYDLLRRHDVGFCVISAPGQEYPAVATADFAYIRFHGSHTVYGGCYTDEELERWAGIARELGRESRMVFAYFNNDANAYAVYNALTLKQKLGSK
ncbi:MAG: DUF72 domain-containing protein [Chloroflexi bacterium]|nr:DUF72 domain-containing protein [Chloroflexota bacterium]